MTLVYASDVGEPAWARMVRDGVVTPLTRGSGHAADALRSPALRAASVASWVPRRAALSGLAALWVYGWHARRPAPAAIEVAVERGSHPGTPPGVDASAWAFVTDQEAVRSSRVIGGVAVACVGQALGASLARAPLALAIEAAFWARAHGLVDDAAVRASLRTITQGDSRARARSAWDAVWSASGAR